jgi:hypothetical protein
MKIRVSNLPNTSNLKIQTLNSLASLISIQTSLYQIERSLSESWRARSNTRSGFDVAYVNASIALGKLQGDNTTATRIPSNIYVLDPRKISKEERDHKNEVLLSVICLGGETPPFAIDVKGGEKSGA